MGARRTIDWDRVAAMAAQGRSVKQIAARMGCSERSVTRILHELEKKKEDGK